MVKSFTLVVLYAGFTPCPNKTCLFNLLVVMVMRQHHCHLTAVHCHFPGWGQPMSPWTAQFGVYLPTHMKKWLALCCTAATLEYSFVPKMDVP